MALKFEKLARILICIGAIIFILNLNAFRLWQLYITIMTISLICIVTGLVLLLIKGKTHEDEQKEIRISIEPFPEPKQDRMLYQRKRLRRLKIKLQKAEELGEQRQIVNCLSNIGWIYYAQKKYDEALQLYKKALQVINQSQNAFSVEKRQLLRRMGDLFWIQNNFAEAARHYEEALPLFGKVKHTKKVYLLELLGVYYFRQGNDEKSSQMLEEAIQLWNQAGIPRRADEIRKFMLEGQILLYLGEFIREILC